MAPSLTGLTSSLARRAARLPFPLSAPTVPGSVEPPPAPVRSGPDYDTSWARRTPARVARAALLEAVARPAVAALADPQRHGLDRLDELRHEGGPVIFAPNHHSHVDTPLMLTSIPEPWRHRLFVAAAADYFFRTTATSALSALVIGAIPLDRTRVSRRSADRAAALIDDGWSMLIFPEGGRSPDGWGQPFRGGAAYLALRCDVPVVPVHLQGTGRILRKGRRVPQPATTHVTFGAPLRPVAGQDARRFGVVIEAAVAQLADEATTDWWSARRRAHAGTTPPLVGP
ncbi:MAG TPA: lysophospholipid acyltransferase family protein, partial [Acidimicrobiales bacterium]